MIVAIAQMLLGYTVARLMIGACSEKSTDTMAVVIAVIGILVILTGFGSVVSAADDISTSLNGF